MLPGYVVFIVDVILARTTGGITRPNDRWWKMTTITINQEVHLDFSYTVNFTQSAFAIDNHTLRDVLISPARQNARLLVVVDENVAKSNVSLSKQILAYGEAHDLELLSPFIFSMGGEQVKQSMDIVEAIHLRVAEDNIDRHSYILVIGGGALIDAVGYAAATAHRGIRLVRMPSTVLAQNDAGIGVKNGINYLDRKNFLGTFTPPYAVINDVDLLASLDVRDKRAGIAEAVKVALIKDAEFFTELYTRRFELRDFDAEAMQSMIVRCAQLHLVHIRDSGDPFELGTARPLDYGHWSAHALETISEYQLRHGEAVAIGIAIDTCYCALQGKISEEQKEQVLTLLTDIGFSLCCDALKQLDISAALQSFREHLGGALSITMLDGIGTCEQVETIDLPNLQASVDYLLSLGE